MKNGLKLLFISLLVISSMTVKAQLQEHIDKAKIAYNEYADIENHNVIKSSKEVTSYGVGDSRMFWRYNLSVMPPSWIQQSATCRAVGEHSYIFVADADWGTHMTQEDVDSIYNCLENVTVANNTMGVVEMCQTYFGTIPDELDADPKVIFYYSALGSYAGSVFDGYFSPFNQMTDAEAQGSGEHSNECEMLYMSCDPVNPLAPVTLAVMAHELEHLIHFGHDSNEESWVDEGCAEFAMVLFGVPDPIMDFQQEPNNNLMTWNQDYSDYVKTMLFFTYISEQTTGPDFITQIVANPLNGVIGLEDCLTTISFPLDFQQIFSNWTLANFINDNTFGTGMYGYDALDLPAFTTEQYFTSYPATTSNTLNDCAAHYYRLNTTFSSLDISMNYDIGGEWDINLLVFENSVIKEVIPFVDNALTFDFPLDYTISKLILVVTKKELGTSSKPYGISINNISGITDISGKNEEFSIYPNPATNYATINYVSGNVSSIEFKLLDVLGQEVDVQSIGNISDGNYTLTLSTEELLSGIYFVLLNNGSSILRKKLVVQ